MAVIRSIIRGVGAHLPKRVVTNNDLSKIVDTTGAELPGDQLLIRALVLRRLLRRFALQPDERQRERCAPAPSSSPLPPPSSS